MDAAQLAPPVQVLTKQQFVLVAAAVAAMVAFNVFFVGGLVGGPARIVAGEGPLGVIGGSGLGFFDDHGGRPPWTVGIGLCLMPGSQLVVLDGSVGPNKIAGKHPPPALDFLGALVREFTPSLSHSPVVGMEGFPPNLPDKLQPVKGFVVTTPCLAQTNPDHFQPYTELLIGLGADRVNTGGGGWLGVDVGYTSGWRHYLVSIDYQVVVCGPNAVWLVCIPVPSPSA